MNERHILKRMVNKNQIPLKECYSLLINNPIKSKLTRQSEYLHDNFYKDEISNLCHIYLKPELSKYRL